MGIFKEWIILIILEICVADIIAIRIDDRSQKQSYSQRIPSPEDENTYRQGSNFNPGNAQLGGWQIQESNEFNGIPFQNNQWQLSDTERYEAAQRQSQFGDILEGQGTSYNPGPNAVKPSQPGKYSQLEVGKQLVSGQYSGIGPASSINSGDLIVGQGSVQRPANFAARFASGNYNQAIGGSPIAGTKAGSSSQSSQSGPQYTHIVSSNGKKPSKPASDFSQYSNQRPSVSYRPVGGKPSPNSSQFLSQSPQTFSTFTGGQPTHLKPQFLGQPQNSNQYPQYVASRPSLSASKPSYRPVSGDGFFQQGSSGSRHPLLGVAGARPGGVKYPGVKFPSGGQASKTPYSSGQSPGGGGNFFSGFQK